MQSYVSYWCDREVLLSLQYPLLCASKSEDLVTVLVALLVSRIYIDNIWHIIYLFYKDFYKVVCMRAYFIIYYPGIEDVCRLPFYLVPECRGDNQELLAACCYIVEHGIKFASRYLIAFQIIVGPPIFLIKYFVL